MNNSIEIIINFNQMRNNGAETNTFVQMEKYIKVSSQKGVGGLGNKRSFPDMPNLFQKIFVLFLLSLPDR